MVDENRDSARHGWRGGLAGGLAAVLVGLVFLLKNLGVPLPFVGLHNWWALFILVGAVPLLVTAAESYRRDGRISAAVLHSLLSAAAILLVAAFFLLDLDWSVWWPLWVIYGGLWAMLGATGRRSTQS